MKSQCKYLILSLYRGVEDIDLVDCLLLLLLGAEKGGCSRNGDATTKDGEGDDAGKEADGGPEHMLDWVQMVGGFLLELMPPCRPVKAP